MRERRVWVVEMQEAGVTSPWPQALELADELTPGSWSLIGGLMVQLHVLHAGLELARVTRDVDVVLHIETDRASWGQARRELESLGYELRRSMDHHSPPHRFVRGDETVDVMVADHVAPRAYARRSGGENLVRAPGGTSALRKTVDCHVQVGDGRAHLLSVPDVLGALSLKGGAFLADSRERVRHLEDAVMLAATVGDARGIHANADVWTGGDPGRIRALHQALPVDHYAWALLEQGHRRRAQAALRVLASGRPPRRQPGERPRPAQRQVGGELER